MCAFHRIAVMAALLAAATPGMANDPTKLIGVWQVVSYEMEYQATGAKEYTRGKNPNGVPDLHSGRTSNTGPDR